MFRVVFFLVLFFVSVQVFSEEPSEEPEEKLEVEVDCSALVLQISLLNKCYRELGIEKLCFFCSKSTYHDEAMDTLVDQVVELLKLEDLHCS